MFETVYGVSSSFTVAASFNRSKQCSQLYMYSLFEKNDGGLALCGLGVSSQDKIELIGTPTWPPTLTSYENALNWNYDLPCLTQSAQVLFTATNMNWPDEINTYIPFDVMVCFLNLLKSLHEYTRILKQ